MTEIQALQNAANDLELVIHEKINQDKRKTVKTYFAEKLFTEITVSPVLDYENMNHFLLGWRKCLKYICITSPDNIAEKL